MFHTILEQQEPTSHFKQVKYFLLVVSLTNTEFLKCKYVDLEVCLRIHFLCCDLNNVCGVLIDETLS